MSDIFGNTDSASALVKSGDALDEKTYETITKLGKRAADIFAGLEKNKSESAVSPILAHSKEENENTYDSEEKAGEKSSFIDSETKDEENSEKTQASKEADSVKHEVNEGVHLISQPNRKFKNVNVSINDNKIVVNKTVKLKFSSIGVIPEIPGEFIEGILFCRPTLVRDGYFTFRLSDKVDLHMDLDSYDPHDPELDSSLAALGYTFKELMMTADLDWNDSMDICKVCVEYAQLSETERFLSQVSKDTGIGITYITR